MEGAQLKPGQLVLIKQQSLAPLQWLLGRIQEVHPGSGSHESLLFEQLRVYSQKRYRNSLHYQ